MCVSLLRVLLLAFGWAILLSIASNADAAAPAEYYSTQPIQKLSCSNPNVYGSNNCPPSSADPSKTEVHYEQTGAAGGSDPSVYWRYYYCLPAIDQNGTSYPLNGWDSNLCYYGEPPPPPECSLNDGDISFIAVGNSSGTGCYDDCMYTGWSDNSWIYGGGTGQGNATTNGQLCSNDDSVPPDDACNESGGTSGNQYCDNTSPDYVPPDDDGGEPCDLTGGPSGNNFCGEDNGNYDDPNDGSDPGGGDGEGDGEGDGTGTGDGDGEGDGTGDGEGEGEEQEECEGDDCCEGGDCPFQMGTGVAPSEDCETAEQCVAAQWARIKASPPVSAINSMGSIIPQGGSCAPLVIDLSSMKWGTVSTSIQCEIASDIRAYISAIMLCFFAVMGIRVIASA